MIKLIATDIDGTLVKDGASTLPEGMAETIAALMDKGIVFVAASGRSLISLERLFYPIKERIYYAACNGTQTGTYKNLMFAENLDKKLLKELIEDIRQYENTVPFLTNADTMYSDTEDEELLTWLAEGYQENITRVQDIARMPDEFVKLSVYDKSLRSGETFRGFREKWQGLVSTATAGSMWLDVYKSGVNKGTAIKRLQEHLGITPEETMAFGDQQNDIEMLKAAYHSYAVANALPQVKETARYVTDSNVDGGALKVFRSLL